MESIPQSALGLGQAAPAAYPGHGDCNLLWQQLQQLVQSREARLSAREQEVQQQAQQHQHLQQLLVDLSRHIQNLTNGSHQELTSSTPAAVAVPPSEAVVQQFLQQMLQHTPEALPYTSNADILRLNHTAAAASDTALTHPAVQHQQHVGYQQQQQQQEQPPHLPREILNGTTGVGAGSSAAAAAAIQRQQQASDVPNGLACSDHQKPKGSKRMRRVLSQLQELDSKLSEERQQLESLQQRMASDLQQAQEFAAFLLADAESAARFRTWQQRQQQGGNVGDRQPQQDIHHCHVCGASLVQDAVHQKKGKKKRKSPEQQDADQQQQQQEEAKLIDQPFEKQRKRKRGPAQRAKQRQPHQHDAAEGTQFTADEPTDHQHPQRQDRQQHQEDVMLQYLPMHSPKQATEQQEVKEQTAPDGAPSLPPTAAAASCAEQAVQAEAQQRANLVADDALVRTAAVPTVAAATVRASPAADDILGALYKQQEAENAQVHNEQQSQHSWRQQQQPEAASVAEVVDKSATATAVADCPSAAVVADAQDVRQHPSLFLKYLLQQQQQQRSVSPPVRLPSPSPPAAAAAAVSSPKARRITPTLVAPVESRLLPPPAEPAAAVTASTSANLVLPANGAVLQESNAVSTTTAAAGSHCQTPHGRSPVKHPIFKPTVPRARRPAAAAAAAEDTQPPPSAGAATCGQDPSKLTAGSNLKSAAAAAAAASGEDQSDYDDPELQAAAAGERGASPGVGFTADEKRRRQRNQYAGIFVRRFDQIGEIGTQPAAAPPAVGVSTAATPGAAAAEVGRSSVLGHKVPQGEWVTGVTYHQQQQQQQDKGGEDDVVEHQQDEPLYHSSQQQQQQQRSSAEHVGQGVPGQNDHLVVDQQKQQHDRFLQEFSHFGQAPKQQEFQLQLAGKPWLLGLHQQQQDTPLFGSIGPSSTTGTECTTGKQGLNSGNGVLGNGVLGNGAASRGQGYNQQQQHQQQRPAHKKTGNNKQQQHQQHKGHQQRHQQQQQHNANIAKHPAQNAGGAAGGGAAGPGAATHRRHNTQHGAHGNTAAAAGGGRAGFGRRLEEEATEQELAAMVEELRQVAG